MPSRTCTARRDSGILLEDGDGLEVAMARTGDERNEVVLERMEAKLDRLRAEIEAISRRLEAVERR